MLAAARRAFADAPEPFIDLSTGINPVAYPIPELAPDAFARLPEPEAVTRLEQAAARAYGVGDAAMVVAAPGTQVLISLLPLLFPAASVAILSPTYGGHEAAWRDAGCQVVRASHLSELEQATVAVVCNPNNPDGRRTEPQRLLALADRLARGGGLLVVDEAFADFEKVQISVAPALPHPGLLVLRSFGKCYGLAGLRLGFALASPGLTGRLRAALGPWAVSGPAIAIGCAALDDTAWLQSAAMRLRYDAAQLDRCAERAGLALVGGTNLFRLYRTEAAGAVYERLGQAGILVRRFVGHPTWLRFGIPVGAQHSHRLDEAFSAITALAGS